ncbi:Hypothetical protein, putative [Bodo saltans]|uniref:Uncharacterized protein n=1 Tax=Bodo saltans TaxID=75058 RepID=A0A0S4J8T8_BODSA|nr:Hypothetical protein, putative [Bodo saltans]|eukprot:CUG86767.1 Hypothetical protein, putative [Bodo saltans]
MAYKGVTYNNDLTLDTFAAARDDDRADQAFRAWGSRRVTVASSRPGSSTNEFHQPGAVNTRSLRTMSRLPQTAHPVDAIFREPQRASGGWTFIKPFHQQYEFYRHYSNAGGHALSSHHHNFPGGDVPAPTRIYSAEPQSRITTVRMNRPKRYSTIGTMTKRAYPSPLYVNYHEQ